MINTDVQLVMKARYSSDEDADIVALIRYLIGQDEEIYAGADVNSDGRINVIDLCNLKSMILAG